MWHRPLLSKLGVCDKCPPHHIAAERRRKVARGESEANTPGNESAQNSCRVSGTGTCRAITPVPLTRHKSWDSLEPGVFASLAPWLPSDAAPRRCDCGEIQLGQP